MNRAVLARARRSLARGAAALADTAARPGVTQADILVAEVLPLLAAMRFLERYARRILAERRPEGRPLWLFGTRLVVRRVPLGQVLVVGPSNYPLLLPGIQVLQALAAGNTVAVKPAPGCSAPMRALREALLRAGLAAEAFTVLDETNAAVAAAIPAADHVVLTGSAETGRTVLALLAPNLVPATMELSGRDAMIVLAGADVDLAARAAAYGLRLNAGRTCIAPRRIVVDASLAAAFRAALAPLLDGPALPVADGVRAALADTPAMVEADGMRAQVIEAAPDAAWVHRDLFAPLAALHVARDAAHAVALADAGPYALGASVFGPGAAAVARRLRAGCVVIDDMIVPTADPALPFGGTGASGFGVTRGAEGLLAMTRPQAVVIRHRRSVRHLTPLSAAAAPRVARLIRWFYGVV